MNAMAKQHERRLIAFVENKRGQRFRLNKAVSLPRGKVRAEVPKFPEAGLAHLVAVDERGMVLERKRMQGEWLKPVQLASAQLLPLPPGEIVLDVAPERSEGATLPHPT